MAVWANPNPNPNPNLYPNPNPNPDPNPDPDPNPNPNPNQVATGDEQQKLRLFRRADCAVGAAAPSHAYAGHAGVLSAVRFSYDDRYVLSVGGEDLCAFVWRIRGASAGPGEEGEEAEEEGSDDDDDDSDVETGGGTFSS